MTVSVTLSAAPRGDVHDSIYHTAAPRGDVHAGRPVYWVKGGLRAGADLQKTFSAMRQGERQTENHAIITILLGRRGKFNQLP